MGTQKEEKSGSLLHGTLDLLILRTLVNGAKHGYDIAGEIEQRSEEVLRVEEGALYPALHRLELRGLVASGWGVSANNRRAKYYRLTGEGIKYLERERCAFARLSSAVMRVLEA